MLMKLFDRGEGSIEACFDYLLGEKRDREEATLLTGDPDLIMDIAGRDIDGRSRFTVGCLSFEETDLTDLQKQEIMRSFEATFFPAFESDQFAITWIQHKDKHRLELNFVIPNKELRSERAFYPYVHQTHLALKDVWTELINHKYGLSLPNDPARAELVQRKKKTIDLQALAKKKASGNLTNNEIRELINKDIKERLEQGLINTRADVVEVLKEYGTVPKITNSFMILGVNINGKEKEIKLQGKAFQTREFRQDLQRKFDSTDLSKLESKYLKELARIKRLHTERYKAVIGHRHCDYRATIPAGARTATAPIFSTKRIIAETTNSVAETARAGTERATDVVSRARSRLEQQTTNTLADFAAKHTAALDDVAKRLEQQAVISSESVAAEIGRKHLPRLADSARELTERNTESIADTRSRLEEQRTRTAEHARAAVTETTRDATSRAKQSFIDATTRSRARSSGERRILGQSSRELEEQRTRAIEEHRKHIEQQTTNTLADFAAKHTAALDDVAKRLEQQTDTAIASTRSRLEQQSTNSLADTRNRLEEFAEAENSRIREKVAITRASVENDATRAATSACERLSEASAGKSTGNGLEALRKRINAFRDDVTRFTTAVAAAKQLIDSITSRIREFSSQCAAAIGLSKAGRTFDGIVAVKAVDERMYSVRERFEQYSNEVERVRRRLVERLGDLCRLVDYNVKQSVDKSNAAMAIKVFNAYRDYNKVKDKVFAMEEARQSFNMRM